MGCYRAAVLQMIGSVAAFTAPKDSTWADRYFDRGGSGTCAQVWPQVTQENISCLSETMSRSVRDEWHFGHGGVVGSTGVMGALKTLMAAGHGLGTTLRGHPR